jgi:hypothetical protein
MTEIVKPLQATFDVDDYAPEVGEGVGFEKDTRYEFVLEQSPKGTYIQYGSKREDGLANLYFLKKQCPKDLSEAYKKHPDQFEIFTIGEINGQPAQIPGKDFEKFRPFMSKTLDITWVYLLSDGNKRLVFMRMGADDKLRISVDPQNHPEWDSDIVRLSRKCGYIPPNPKSKERFSMDWLHPGLTISAEVVMEKQKVGPDRAKIDINTIEVVSTDGKAEPQKKIVEDEIDPEMEMTVIELADGCKSTADVIRKVKAKLKDDGKSELQGQYMTVITKLKDAKKILA